MMEINKLNSRNPDFWQILKNLLAWEQISDDTVTTTVRNIIQNVRKRGDAAILEYTQRFDQLSANSIDELNVTTDRLKQALDTIPTSGRHALEFAAQRLRDYHQQQKMQSWSYTEDDGSLLGQQITPLRSRRNLCAGR